jgi:carbamoyltransferase
MQGNLEKEILGYIRAFQKTTGARHLYYSGGAALNIHANVRIEQELGFESVHIPPAPSDAGLALGAAAFMEWRGGHVVQKHCAFLNTLAVDSPTTEATHDVEILHACEDAARAINDGKIIAVWVGDAEIGPRALGHRSLLARPDSVALRRRLSEEMKQREWYRPVAPMLLEDVAREALLDLPPRSNLGRFMLGAWKLAPGWRTPFAGCVHHDGTVRAQIVDEGDRQLRHIHQLLRFLHEQHGIPGAINTSFNGHGTPIIHGVVDAVRVADALGVDALWLPDKAEVWRSEVP